MTDKRYIDQLLDILSFLRTHEDGCAWTKEQTHKSLIPSLIEESYETAETIDKGQTFYVHIIQTKFTCT